MQTPFKVTAAARRHSVVVLLVLSVAGCGDRTAPNNSPTPDKKGEKKSEKQSEPSGKTYRTTKELVADLPKNKYPFGGAKERSDCREWLKANVVGRTIEWPATVMDVTDRGNGPFLVGLVLSGDRHVYEFSYTELGNGGTPSQALRFGPGFKLDGNWCTGLLVEGGLFGVLMLRGSSTEYTVQYSDCTGPELEALRKFKGKTPAESKVVLRATIAKVDVTLKDFPARDNAAGIPTILPPPDPTRPDPVVDPSIDRDPSTAFLFAISPPSVNDYLPESSRPKR